MNKRIRLEPFATDIISAFFFYAALTGVWGLVPVIARNRLGADEIWIGVIGAAGYAGYMWNLLFGRLCARFSIKNAVLAGMLASAGLTFIAANISNAILYCLVAVVWMLSAGFYELQYNTLVPHLYSPEERPKRLSARQFVVSGTAAGVAAALGWLCAFHGSHRGAFLIGGAMMALGVAVFTRISISDKAYPEPFNAVDVVRTVWHDRRFRKTALVLILYGWFGAGIATLLVLLYKHLGFDEGQIGRLLAWRTGGMMLGLFLITPRLKFSGGITNFRLCFYAAALASAVYLAAAARVFGDASMLALICAEVTLGISGAGFVVGAQTTGPSLAGSGNVSLYVNALMVVLATRGMLAPLLVAFVTRSTTLITSMVVSVVVTFACAAFAIRPDHALHNEREGEVSPSHHNE